MNLLRYQMGRIGLLLPICWGLAMATGSLALQYHVEFRKHCCLALTSRHAAMAHDPGKVEQAMWGRVHLQTAAEYEVPFSLLLSLYPLGLSRLVEFVEN